MRAVARRVGIVAGLGLAVPVLLALTAHDAARRRAARQRQQEAIDVVAARLPAPALALSGGGRWLRAPALEEPGAAFAEGPAMPDADPAGGTMAPPVEQWAAEARRR